MTWALLKGYGEASSNTLNQQLNLDKDAFINKYII